MKGLVIGFICFLVVSCVQTTVNEVQPEYGVIVVGVPTYFSHVKTFTWHPIAAKAFLDANHNNHNALDVYKKAIENNMVGKGYTYLDDLHADVVVSFGLAQESQLSDDILYQGTALSTGVETFYYDDKQAEKGSVYIVFFGRNLQVPSWKVLAQGAMLPKMTLDETRIRAEEVVAMMLRRVPVK